MQLILEAGADWRRKNLLISDEVAVIILDEYGDAGFRDIVFVERNTPNKPLWYSCISLAYTVYIPLYYILLFLCGDTG